MLYNISNSLSIVKILTGISKSLGIVKELVPIYNEISPLVKKLPKFYQIINNKNNSMFVKNPIKNNQYNSQPIEKIEKNTKNGPTFFQ